jgi:hypothetical protein
MPDTITFDIDGTWSIATTSTPWRSTRALRRSDGLKR